MSAARLVLFGLSLQMCLLDLYWCVSVCMRVSVLCVDSINCLLSLAAQPSVDRIGEGLLILDRPEEDKLAKVIVRPEAERLQSSAFHHILSDRATAGWRQRFLMEKLS